MALEDIRERPVGLQQHLLRLMIVGEQRKVMECDQSSERRQKTATFPLLMPANTLMKQNQEAVNDYSRSRIFYYKIYLMQGSSHLGKNKESTKREKTYVD